MVRIERKEEITIQCDDIHEAAENIFHEFGYDPGDIPDEEYIIDEIFMKASATELDDDDLEGWRKQIDKRVWDDLIEQFWNAYKGYADSMFTIKVENAKALLKRSN